MNGPSTQASSSTSRRSRSFLGGVFFLFTADEGASVTPPAPCAAPRSGFGNTPGEGTLPPRWPRSRRSVRRRLCLDYPHRQRELCHSFSLQPAVRPLPKGAGSARGPVIDVAVTGLWRGFIPWVGAGPAVFWPFLWRSPRALYPRRYLQRGFCFFTLRSRNWAWATQRTTLELHIKYTGAGG